MGGPADRRGRDFGVQSGEAAQLCPNKMAEKKNTEKKTTEKRKSKEVATTAISGQV